MASTTWKTYEEVAQFLLNEMAEKLDLVRVEGKQTVFGEQSSTDWEIDAKGIADDNGAFVIIECRHKKKALTQEEMAGLAYRIQDTGAVGGIIVTPMGLQRGAKIVAASANIRQVILSRESTRYEYLLRLLNEIHLGFSNTVRIREGFKITVKRDGEVVQEWESNSDE